MKTPHKIYYLTDCGADATAHEEEDCFIVHAGSKLGPIKTQKCGVMLGLREVLERLKLLEEDGITLRNDFPFSYADDAARVISGSIIDELWWTAIDGSHPTLVSPLEDRQTQNL